jgi:hypothetical protein
MKEEGDRGNSGESMFVMETNTSGETFGVSVIRCYLHSAGNLCHATLMKNSRRFQNSQNSILVAVTNALGPSTGSPLCKCTHH